MPSKWYRFKYNFNN